jgi:hypothetical protein
VFGTKSVKALVRFVVSAVLLSAAWPQTASAVTSIAPSTTAAGAQSNPTALLLGQSYATSGFQSVDAGTPFDNYYAFTTTVPLGTVITASVLEADPVANGPFGVAGLTIEWLGLGASAAFTDSNGVLNTGARLVAALTAGGPYILHVFGTALADGGLYSLRLTTSASETPSPVPLPPAILLLGSVLGGLAATRLRRRGHARA